MEDGRASSQVSLTTTNFTFMCSDLMGLITISILYGIGKDKSCGVAVDDILLAYIIIKASLVLVRCCLWGIVIVSAVVGAIITIVFMIIWICGMIAYYIIVIVVFFDGDNDWLDKNTVHWVGFLLVLIEAIGSLAVIPLIWCMIACLVPLAIAAAKAGS